MWPLKKKLGRPKIKSSVLNVRTSKDYATTYTRIYNKAPKKIPPKKKHQKYSNILDKYIHYSLRPKI